MKTQRKMSRWFLARRLHDLALRIAAGKPVRIGNVSVRVPDQVVLEEGVETEEGRTELEFELKWPVATVLSSNRLSRRFLRKRDGRSS